MILDVLPDIPRAYTGLAEWAACVVYGHLAPRRTSRARTLVALTGGLPLLVGVQVLAGTLPLRLWIVGMATAVTAMAVVVRLATGLPAAQVCAVVARALVLAEFTASLQWQMHAYFFVGAPHVPAGPAIALLVTVDAAVLVAAHRLERRHFPPGEALDVDHRGMLSAAAIAAITFLMSNLSFVDAQTPFSGTVGSSVFYIRTLVDLAGYVALFAQHGQRRELRRAAELATMDRLLRLQHEQYLQSKGDIDIVNRKYHDLKHYLAAIRAAPDASTRTAHLDELEDSIRAYGARVETGNVVLDTLLTAKSTFCADRQVTLTCVVDGAALDFVDPMDLSALVGNALDNAAEAALTVREPDRRLIQCSVFRRDGFVMLRVENVFDGPLVLDGDLPRTTKDDTGRHGYGLRNMRQIAERYAGTLSVDVEGDWFAVRVLLPVPAGAADRAGAVS